MKSISDNLISIYGIADMFPYCSKAFKQLQLQDIMKVPQGKPDIEQIISVSANTEITNIKIISTTPGRSCEGQIMRNKKLIVEGKLLQKMEYVADLANQPVHAAHFNIPFSSFIILGKDIDCYGDFDVTGYIEDIYIKQLDKRRVFKNVLLLLNAVPVSKI